MNTAIRGDIPIVSTNIAASVQMNNFTKEVTRRTHRVESTRDSSNINVKPEQEQKSRKPNSVGPKSGKPAYRKNTLNNSSSLIDYVV